jgi:3-isopropylmalate/(R)-2-methylmalate dehydratase small subunit
VDRTLNGKAWVFGDDIDTDVIIPARYLVTSDPQELGKHCMEDIDPAFVEKIAPGDLIVAGENFGCGSSREHAPLALKGAFCGGVIAVSFARIFYRNAINVGFPIFECPEAKSHIQEGDTLTVCPSSGTIGVERTGEILHFAPFPPFLEGLISSGGLIPFVRKELKVGEER